MENEDHGVVLFSLKPPSLLLGYLNPSTLLPSTPLLPSPQHQELPLPTPHHLTPQTSSFKDISTPPPFHPSCSEDTSTLPPIQPSFSTPLLPSSHPLTLLHFLWQPLFPLWRNLLLLRLPLLPYGNPCSYCGYPSPPVVPLLLLWQLLLLWLTLLLLWRPLRLLL